MIPPDTSSAGLYSNRVLLYARKLSTGRLIQDTRLGGNERGTSHIGFDTFSNYETDDPVRVEVKGSGVLVRVIY